MSTEPCSRSSSSLVTDARGNRGVEVDVATVVDGERHGVHPEVALEEPAVDAGVVLVGVAAHERVDAEGVLADVEADRGLEVLLPRQRQREDAGAVLDVLDPVAVEVVTDGAGDGGVAHTVISSRMRVRASR